MCGRNALSVSAHWASAMARTRLKRCWRAGRNTSRTRRSRPKNSLPVAGGHSEKNGRGQKRRLQKVGNEVQPERDVQNSAVLARAENQQCRGTAGTCSDGNRTLPCYGGFHQAAEARLTEIAVLKTHIINYAKTREVYATYRKAGYSKAFLEAHREEIALHKAAKAAFDEAGLQKLPKVKALDAEFAELLTKKKAATRTTARHGTRCRN